MNNSEESSNKPVSNQLGTSALLLNNPLLDETSMMKRLLILIKIA